MISKFWSRFSGAFVLILLAAVCGAKDRSFAGETDPRSGYSCEFWLIVPSASGGEPYNVLSKNQRKSNARITLEVLKFENLPHQVVDDVVTVPCYIYQDMSYISKLSEIILSPETPKRLSDGSLPALHIQSQNLHSFLKCEFWLYETDPKNFFTPWYLSTSTYSAEEIEVIDDILDVEGVRHSVIGSKVAVECAIFQDESYLLTISDWVRHPEDRPWLNSRSWATDSAKTSIP